MEEEATTTSHNANSGGEELNNLQPESLYKTEEKAEEASKREEEFPLEVWKLVIGKLHEMGIHPKRHPYLWNCRRVCKAFRKIVDEVMKEKLTLWNTSFEPGPSYTDEWFSLLDKLVGTRLSTLEEVDKFIIEMIGSPNPFPNGTLILSPTEKQTHLQLEGQELDLFSCLTRLVHHFREHIHALIYPLNGKHHEEFTQILTICKLKNLKSLVIHKDQWGGAFVNGGVKLIKTMSNFEDIGCPLPSPVGLKELQIFGGGSILPPVYLFPLFKNVISSLTHLRCSPNSVTTSKTDLDFLETQLTKFKQISLTHLKLIAPHERILELLLMQKKEDLKPLKELGLYFLDSCLPSMGKLAGGVFLTLDKSRAYKDLELLQIDVEEDDIYDLEEDELKPEPPLNPSIKYLKVTHLILGISAILYWESFITEIGQKLCNLRKVTVRVNDTNMDGKRPKDIHDFIQENLWDKFPPSMKVIEVPYLYWTLMRKDVSIPDLKSI